MYADFFFVRCRFSIEKQNPNQIAHAKYVRVFFCFGAHKLNTIKYYVAGWKLLQKLRENRFAENFLLSSSTRLWNTINIIIFYCWWPVQEIMKNRRFSARHNIVVYIYLYAHICGAGVGVECTCENTFDFSPSLIRSGHKTYAPSTHTHTDTQKIKHPARIHRHKNAIATNSWAAPPPHTRFRNAARICVSLWRCSYVRSAHFCYLLFGQHVHGSTLHARAYTF